MVLEAWLSEHLIWSDIAPPWTTSPEENLLTRLLPLHRLFFRPTTPISSQTISSLCLEVTANGGKHPDW